MATSRLGARGLRACRQQPLAMMMQLEQGLQSLQISCVRQSARNASTTSGELPSGPPADAMPRHVRPLPVSPSYFSTSPRFNDSLVVLNTLFRKYGSLPEAPEGQVRRVAWRSLDDYRKTIGETIKASDYEKALSIVKKLHRIHPALIPRTIADALHPFQRDINPYENEAKPIPIDKFGRALGVGRRKTSTARAWVVQGTGEVLINGKSMADAFGRVHDRESALFPLLATERTEKYNIWALVDGGGTTGQAEALTLAIAKGLLAHEPALKPVLRKAGCVTRDSRKVERKKHGHVKARKMPAWVKR